MGLNQAGLLIYFSQDIFQKPKIFSCRRASLVVQKGFLAFNQFPKSGYSNNKTSDDQFGPRIVMKNILMQIKEATSTEAPWKGPCGHFQV
jgi:hypothetical protein